MTCVQLGLPRLVDHVLGELDPPEDEAVEAHLFECDACAAELVTLAGLAGGVARLARLGGVRMVITPSLLARLEADGARMRRFEAQAGDVVPCSVAPDDEYLLSRLRFPPAAAARVDLQFRSMAGDELARMRDVPVAASSGELVFLERASAGDHYPPRFVLRVLSVDGAEEHVLGEYRYEHGPWQGGPSG